LATPSKAVVCEDKARLIRENEEAIERYYQTTMRELERHRATSPTPGYLQLAKSVYDARRFAERAHHALQRHIAKHGCQALMELAEGFEPPTL
jgi:hypothetical protein